MENRVDVLISGAGPTGLMLAALLARRGVGVRIVDKNESAVKESRALAVQARTLELFLKMGIDRPLLEAGMLANGAHVYFDGVKTAEMSFDDAGREDTPFGFILFVPQSRVEAILVEDLQTYGVEVERSCEVVSMAAGPDSVEVHLARPGSDAETVECAYLVGADGSHSVVRKALRLAFQGAPYPSAFLLADCQVDGPLDGEHIKLFLRQQRFGIQFPLLGQGLSRIMVQVEDADSTHAQGSSTTTLEEVEAAFRHVSHSESRLSNATWLSHYKVHHRGVERYRVGRAFLAGDAAHIHSPAGGQGMNTGLQDAANLAWKLALVLHHGAPDTLLDTYHEERWPIGQKVLTYTDKAFSTMAQPQGGWKSTLREHVMPHLMGPLTRLSAVRSRAFHYISQLGIRYHPNLAVSDENPPKPLLQPGQRAPNAVLQRHLDVFDLLAGYQFDLLALTHKPLTSAEVQAADDRLEQVRQRTAALLATHLVGHCLAGRNDAMVRTECPDVFAAYGLVGAEAQALVLVRPDGYVAFSASGFDWEALERFLVRLGAPLASTC